MPWRLLRWSQTVDVLPLVHLQAEVLPSPVHLSSYLLRLEASTTEVPTTSPPSLPTSLPAVTESTLNPLMINGVLREKQDQTLNAGSLY